MNDFIQLSTKFAEQTDVKEFLGDELVDQMIVTGHTTREAYDKLKAYFSDMKAKYDSYKQLLDEEEARISYQTTYSAKQIPSQLYINSLKEILSIRIKEFEDLYKNYHVDQHGLIINKNSKTVYHDFSIKDFNELLKDFDNITHIPDSIDNIKFFNIMHYSFKNKVVYSFEYLFEELFFRYTEDEISLLKQDYMNDFFAQVKIVFGNPKNWSKLEKLGLDTNKIGISLINGDFNTIEKYCIENTDPNIYKIAHNFLLIEIAEKLWSANESNGYKNFSDVLSLTLNGVQRTEIVNDTVILSNSTYLKDISDLEFTSEKKLPPLGMHKIIASFFSDYGEQVWNQVHTQAIFNALDNKVMFTKAYGSGNNHFNNSKIPVILKDFNSNKEADTFISVIFQHGVSEYENSFHDVIFDLPTNIADNQIYFLMECFSGIKINLINFNGKQIPENNLLYISQASATEKAWSLDGIQFQNYTAFNKFFAEREVTIENFANYILESVPTSTPHVSGYYHQEAVGPCKLSEFIEDLNDPYSIYNQVGGVCNAYNYEVIASGDNFCTNSLDHIN